jgi:hypothetical protein
MVGVTTYQANADRTPFKYYDGELAEVTAAEDRDDLQTCAFADPPGAACIKTNPPSAPRGAR